MLFSHHLTVDERDALVVLLAFMAATDGEVRDVERQFVRELCHRLDVSADPFDRVGKESLFDKCGRFRTPRSRRIALMEIIRAAHIDGEYHSSEQKSIRVIAELMDVDGDTLVALEEWVERGMHWQAEGMALANQGWQPPKAGTSTGA